MWILQEVERNPDIGITELAGRMGMHQSTCSQLVDKLVLKKCLVKKRQNADHRRVGLCLDAEGKRAMALLPGPAEGILPAALMAVPEIALKTLHINLAELIVYLPGRDETFAEKPLAEILGDERNHAL